MFKLASHTCSVNKSIQNVIFRIWDSMSELLFESNVTRTKIDVANRLKSDVGVVTWVRSHGFWFLYALDCKPHSDVVES